MSLSISLGIESNGFRSSKILLPSTLFKYADGSLAYAVVRFMSAAGVMGAANMHSWTTSGLTSPSTTEEEEEAEAVVIFERCI